MMKTILPLGDTAIYLLTFFANAIFKVSFFFFFWFRVPDDTSRLVFLWIMT